MERYQVFISYRRDGGEHLAGRIADKLKDKGYVVFFDVESMRSGTFNTQIFKAIDSCDDFVLILPPKALDRCKDPDDWVRLEIAYALQKGKNIIPVMMRDFAFPATLPQEIDKVRFYEGVAASSDYFDASVEKIVRLLRSKSRTAVARGTSRGAGQAGTGKWIGIICGAALLVILLVLGIGSLGRGDNTTDETPPSDGPSPTGTQSAADPEMEAKYQLAAGYAREGNFGAAAIAYANCGDYLDAAAQADQCWEKLARYNHDTITAIDNAFLCILPDGTIPKELCYYREMADWTDLVSLSMFAALRADGTVLVPEDLDYDVRNWKDMVSISAGYDFLVGLRKDGTVALTGDWSNGRDAVETWTDIVSVKAYPNAGAVVGLKSDGTAVMAGCDPEYPYDVAHWKNIRNLCTEEGFAVDRNGNVFCVYPEERIDELLGDDGERLKSVLAVKGVEDVANGWCLLQDGKLVPWETNGDDPDPVEAWNDVVCVTVGWEFIIGLRANGTLLLYGMGSSVPGFSDIAKVMLPVGDTSMTDWNLVEAEFENYTLLLKLLESGNYEVRGCTGTGAVELPEKYQYRKIDSIGSAAFYGSGITEFRDHSFLTSVGAYAFADAKQLQSVHLSSWSLRDLSEGVFYRCNGLETVDLPPETGTVGDYAFFGCSALTAFPCMQATRIGNWAFAECVGLQELHLEAHHVGYYAFTGCAGVQNVVLSDGLAEILQGSFSNLERLQELSIPETVTLIEYGAFSGCGALREIHYGGTVAQWRDLDIHVEDLGISDGHTLKIHCQDGTVK